MVRLLLALLAAAPAAAQEVPTCEPLFAARPVIAEVEVVHRPPLGPEDRLPPGLTGAVNRLHRATRPGIVERELLFHAGERLDRERLRDTLRHLRSLGILRRERIRCQPLPGDRVRVVVEAQDAWTLLPVFDLQVVDAGTAWTAGVRETNLAGRGKQLSLTYGNRFGDPEAALHYLDPRLAGSWWRAAADAVARPDGASLAAALSHPYYGLETPWTAALAVARRTGEEARIEEGVVVSGYRATRESLRLEWGRALVAGAPVVHRAGIVFRAGSRRFQPTPSTTTLPRDRSDASLGLAYRRLGVGFVTERQIDHFDRPEYVNLANDLALELAAEGPPLGGDRGGLVLALRDAAGHRFRPGAFVRAAASLSGRLESGRVVDLEAGAG
ncbi:MAG: hypothetical protein D6739_02790, partial [Nitrospirae bacterium]